MKKKQIKKAKAPVRRKLAPAPSKLVARKQSSKFGGVVKIVSFSSLAWSIQEAGFASY